MRRSTLFGAAALLTLTSAGFAAGKPEEELAASLKAILSQGFSADWQGVEKLPGVNWAPLPPRALQNCLPDGGCFARTGTAAFGDRKFALMATGARTIVSSIYLRNPSAAIGEAPVLAALKGAAVTPQLARCPLQAGLGGTNWYRLTAANANRAVLAIQTSCNGKPCEGFVVTPGKDLPPLQPNQLKMYTEQCSAAEGDRKAVSSSLPHEQLAQMIAALIPPVTGPALRDWKTVTTLPAGVEWAPGAAPKKGDLTFKSDPNQWMHTGNFALGGRQFSVLVSGNATHAKTIYLDEGGMHPRGEHLLGVMYSLGYAVKLMRCGPVYTESTNNWYTLTSAKSHPVMLKQSIRYDGQQVQDAYELRLDASLPARDPRDRDPGQAGCR